MTGAKHGKLVNRAQQKSVTFLLITHIAVCFTFQKLRWSYLFRKCSQAKWDVFPLPPFTQYSAAYRLLVWDGGHRCSHLLSMYMV